MTFSLFVKPLFTLAICYTCKHSLLYGSGHTFISPNKKIYLDLFCQISRKTLSEDVRLNTGEHDVILPHRKHVCVGKRDRCYIMCVCVQHYVV